MSEQTDLWSRHAELVGVLRAEESYEETLERVAALACSTIDGCSACSVTLWREGQPYTVVSTDDLARCVDEAQYETLEGPCLDASRYGEVYVIADTTTEGRWPSFCGIAKARGARSSLSLPLAAHDKPIGALNLYSTEPNGFDGASQTALMFAAQAGVAIANSEVYHASRALASQLEEAMASRAVIEQAKGILMALEGCTPDEAFELLRAASQRENVKLRDIAARIVERRA